MHFDIPSTYRPVIQASTAAACLFVVSRAPSQSKGSFQKKYAAFFSPGMVFASADIENTVERA